MERYSDFFPRGRFPGVPAPTPGLFRRRLLISLGNLFAPGASSAAKHDTAQRTFSAKKPHASNINDLQACSVHSQSTLQCECCSYITLLTNELPHSCALSAARMLQICIIGFDCALVGCIDLGFGHVLLCSAELGVSLGDLGIMPEWHPSFAAGREGRSRAAELIHSGVLLSDPVAGRSGVKALRVLFASLAPRAMPQIWSLRYAQVFG